MFPSKSRNLTDPRKTVTNAWRQHGGAFTACLSAFMVGNTFGWSSFSTPRYLNGEPGFSLSERECSLVDSLLTFGAAVSCFPSGWITDKIGRKRTLLGVAPISVLGWCLIVWATSANMLFAGRFLLGISVGTACVTAPVYVTEICQKQIRGAVGSYFQVLLATGVFVAYLIGSEMSVFAFSSICALVPIASGVAFLNFPETPVYYLTQGDIENARKSLKFFRGDNQDVETELEELSEYSCRKTVISKKLLWKSFMSRQGIKGLFMSIGLMVFQQSSGINAFIFNATYIFEAAGSGIDARYETIIIGLMQLIGAFFVTFLADKLGRVLLLGASAICMSVCTFLMGTYFFLKEINFQVGHMSLIPLLSLSVFVVMFSVGFGSVPWMMMPELMPAAIKGPGISIACISNWAAAFVVTRFFSDLVNRLGMGETFWMFSAVSVGAAIFTYTVLPETKGKSLEEIQENLKGDNATSRVDADENSNL